MSIESLTITMLVGAVVGWLAGAIMRGSGYGIVGDIAAGLLGALIGNSLFAAANLSLDLGIAILECVLVAMLGALVLTLIVCRQRARSFRHRATRFLRR